MREGRVIAITRDEESAKDFVNMVKANKGNVIALPTISLVPKDLATMLKFLDLLKTKKYDYVLFMSANAVNIIFDTFTKMQMIEDVLSLLKDTKVAAVGPNTKAALENYGIDVSLMPKKYSSYGIIDLFAKQESKGKKIIIPRSSASTNYLAKSLSQLGMNVDELHVYDIKPADGNSWTEFMHRLASGDIDCMVFTSASSVNSFFEVAIKYESKEKLLDIFKSTKVVAIGPFTNEALAKHNVRAVVSSEHTVKGTFKVATKLLGK
ncbi:MAG: uroporphyrinogen-III synthase [Nitrososphaerales archaeon]